MRLINVDNVRGLFDAEFKKTRKLILAGETHLDNLAEGFAEADRVIWEMPAVDAVVVTRCKDCANFRQNAHGVCWCDEYGGSITPNDYCSRAVTDKQPRVKVPWEVD